MPDAVEPRTVHDDGRVAVIHGDALDALRAMPDASADAVVTDPPYGLAEHARSTVERALLAWLTGDREHVPDGRGFMGRDWDSFVPPPAVWDECFRVLKPGGHLLCFAAPRTVDLMGMSIRLAGFETRDSITWLMAQGFPKSLDVSKAIDRRRDDRADIARVAEWLADRADAGGITRAQVDEHMNTSDMAGWWLSRLPHRVQVPQWEQWEHLRELIGFGDEMDAEVWRLNGRKGTPGEAWEQREVIGERTTGIGTGRGAVAYIADSDDRTLTAPATEDAARWQGYGTALKPASEPIVVARKPLTSTVAATVLTHGTGALNIDGCRVAAPDAPDEAVYAANASSRYTGVLNGGQVSAAEPRATSATSAGRWPPNVVLTHAPDCVPVGTRKVRTETAVNRNRSEDNATSWYGTRKSQTGDDVTYADEDGTETVEAWECVPGCPVAELDAQSGEGSYNPSGAFGVNRRDDNNNGIYGGGKGITQAGREVFGYGDRGGASRFFPVFRYQAKAPARERPMIVVLAEWCGCGHRADDHDGDGCHTEYGAADGMGPCPCLELHDTIVERRKVAHPTVKPLTLMRWLARLVTPPGGLVVDPFAGTGTTGEAARIEGFRAVLIERDPESLPLILDRLTRRTDPVAHLTAKAKRGEDVDLGLFALLDEGTPDA